MKRPVMRHADFPTRCRHVFAFALALPCVAASLVSPPQARAEELGWSLGLNGATGQIESNAAEKDAVLRSGSISLERRLNGYALGGEIGSSSGDTSIPDVVTEIAASSVQGRFWWTSAVGGVDVTAAVSAGRQTLDGVAAAPASAPPALQGRLVAVDAEVRSLGLGVSVSRTWGDKLRLTPVALISFDTSDATVTATAQGSGLSVRGDEESSGVTGALGVELAQPVSERFAVSASLFGLATDNDAAAAFSSQRRSGGLRLVQRGSPEAAQWGEASIGATLNGQNGLGFNVSLGGSFGREHDEIFATAGVSLSF